jgi:hypothetical protein
LLQDYSDVVRLNDGVGTDGFGAGGRGRLFGQGRWIRRTGYRRR